ncbi:MAG: glycogen synthase GlgA [Firmicutes bacterium HGW-Firmicutes-12]|jgi:starch synthase|nr:MAG: glycogen synthase GlgA [Firmicutes bacterium HGW-Firmicutes-12]
MKVLFAAAEAVPFAKTGGLGDVIGSLPKALKKKDIDIRIILPLYDTIPEQYKQEMLDLGTLTVPVAWRKQYCGLKSLVFQGVELYFIDNEYYFKRDRLYGYDDDAERFAFFSRAVLESLPKLGYKPDILHCHDWHTALISVFLRAFYADISSYEGIKTILTIHNISYQGVFSYEVLGDIIGIEQDDSIALNLSLFSRINYLKGGIAYSDELTTVSKTYAKEIITTDYGENLDTLLKEKQNKLNGIINGLDYEDYNPLTDTALKYNYKYSLKKKRKNKLELQREFGLRVGDEVCLFAVVSRLTEQKGIELLISVLPDLIKLKIQLVLLGTGDKTYEKALIVAAKLAPDCIGVRFEFDEALARRIYAGSDIFLMPSRTEPCGLGQLIALRYASIPVVHATGGLKDTICPYNMNNGQGNGFCFEEYSASAFFEAVKEAINIYNQPYLWNGLVKNAAKSNFSWSNAARDYVLLYRNIIRQGKEDSNK